ncbi:MAG: beta-galactosidase [Sedimentisphaerales bacterium]|nr:beta-galactosidase [Sedimentisphaerales bacterium]
MKTNLFAVIVIGSMVFAATSGIVRAAEPTTLFDFSAGFDVGSVVTTDSKASLTGDGTLRIETGRAERWPGVTLKAPGGKWDLSQYEYVSLDVNNLGDSSITLSCRIDNPGADGSKNCVTDSTTVAPKQSASFMVRLVPGEVQLSAPLELLGMRGYPTHERKVDPANVTQLLLFVTKPTTDHVFEIDNIRAGGSVQVIDAKTFIPFIDEFGQFIHRDWSGKTHSLTELVDSRKTEEEDLAANPGPSDRDQYGGWTAGPKLEATGSFRVEKFNGKWWLIDPEGRLFWSHGIDCVGSGNATPISDRTGYFAKLPPANSPFARFYGTGGWAPHGYYKDHSPYKTYDFSQANLLLKYGKTWREDFAEITHRRLKSWGMNTIANWSDSSIYLMRKIPYVCTINSNSRKLEGSEGYWGKFYDVFDPGFRAALAERIATEKDRTADDPWCIGYFVHNEIAWGDELSLAVAALTSPAEQPAKNVFIEDLKAKYRTIEKLNAAWATSHANWQDLLNSVEPPDKDKARADLAAFYTKTAETYFKTIRDELKKAAPNKLYLGCRFAWVNDRAALAATKFCDVVSYNRYSYSVADQGLPENIDMPIIIGEFHFGALDRGMFHTGLRKTMNQQDRADKYKSYVQGALQNPYIVGTHWFQYKDQATTGRGDGENYQIGFVDICDRPYPEIVEACREVGYGMYDYRLKNP